MKRLAIMALLPALALGAPAAFAKSQTGSAMSQQSNHGRIMREFARAGRQSDLRASEQGKSHANWNAGFDESESP